jgi:peptidoglycan/xylan/chitin deacetylase (PgdA/CDA1 family)
MAMPTALAQTAKRALKAIAAVAPTGPAGTVVLIYHRVVERPGGSVEITPATFRRQLTAVAPRVGCLDALIEPAERWPDVVVTVDDGTADFVDEVVPALVDVRVPATLYVATDFVERSRPFNGAPMVSWAGLRDAMSTGLVTIGSHTHRHALLDRTSPDQTAEELDRSIGLIEDRLGVTPAHFAYPKAVLGSADAQAQVRARFATAALAGTRANVAGHTDLHRLHRTPVQQGDRDAHFARKVAGGMRLEDDVRRLSHRVRYRGLTT